ncbi:MAG: hypothetical protein APR63_13190 [Desulfuromonas sp. SDB]|nr:MAG: hypothetical protein APR63_13190 [Desulfuromonas sp. SDB]
MRILLISFIAILSLIASIQAVTWSRVYGTTYNDYAHVIKQTPDGRYIVIGHSEVGVLHNIWLLKLDEFGDTTWSISIDSSFSTSTLQLDIEVDFDSGYVLTCNKVLYDVYPRLYLRIIKLDYNGTVVWSELYNLYESDNNYPYDLDITADSNYIVVGNAKYNNDEAFIMKVNRNSDSVWATTAPESYFLSVCETRENGYITSVVDVYPYPPQVLYKFDSFGNYLLWKSYDELGYCIDNLNDSIFILATESHIFKIDENLDTILSINVGALDLESCIDSGFVSVYEVNSDAYLSKYTNSGDSLWTVQYGSYGDDFFCCVNRTTDGGYICCGATNSWGAGGCDYYIVKTDSLGYAMGVEEEPTQQYPEFPDIFIEYLSSGQIKISFIQSHAGNLNFSVYDLSGRIIDHPLEGFQEEGEHTITLTDYRPGVYFYRMLSGEEEWRGKFQVY